MQATTIRALKVSEAYSSLSSFFILKDSKMEEETKWNWDVKGIPVINFDRNCSHCNIRGNVKSCPKVKIETLEDYAGIFCKYFKENPKNKVPVSIINIENLSGFGISYESEVIRGVFAISEEEHDIYYSYRREIILGDQVERFLRELNSFKGKGSSPEARDLRKKLRKLGFYLKPKKEVT